MAKDDNCRECGQPLPAGASEGLCPCCLTKRGLPGGAEGDASQQEAGHRAETTQSSAPGSGLCLAGKHIGNYRIKRVIAYGGMGCVYEAVQERPRRTVALKVMMQNLVSPTALRRFEYEAQTLARLRHPNIAQIYEAGTYRDPSARGSGLETPYFAMEYIPNGKAITEYAQARKLGTRGRLELFAQVCDAVHHGHQKGIIHRDLKPSNILVDSSGQPKIIDFGVARATDADLAVTALQTNVGALIGTLQYMSPEQCEADPHDLDTRSDVYALGVVLYELLCERLPYDVAGAATYEAVRLIREKSPPRPGTANKMLRGDVETIILKAQEKERQRRYQSAADMAQDIRRYLSNQPIVARPASMAYQFRKFAQRNRTLVAAGILIFVVLIAAVALSSHFAVRERFARERADSLAEEAIRARDAAKQQHIAADNERQKAVDALKRSQRLLHLANMRLAGDALEEHSVRTAKEYLAKCPEEHRHWEWYRLSRLVDPSTRSLRGHESAASSVAVDPGGTKIYSGGHDKTVRVWDAVSGKLLQTLEGHTDTVAAVAVSPDGHWIVSGGSDGAIKVWDAVACREVLTLSGHGGRVTSVAFSPNGERIISGGYDKMVRVWDRRTGKELRSLPGNKHSIYSVTMSPDGQWIISGGHVQITVWRASDGENVRTIDFNASDAAVSPDSEYLVASGFFGAIAVWEIESGKQVEMLRGHHESVTCVSVSPDGTLFASGGMDRTVRLWDANNGRELMTLNGHEDVVRSVAFGSNGQWVVSGGNDGTLKIWDIGSRQEEVVLSTDMEDISFLAFSPDGRLLAAGGEGTTSLAFSPDGVLLATDDTEKGLTCMWDVATRTLLREFPGHKRGVSSVAFRPDGSQLLTAGKDGVIRAWNVIDGSEVFTLAARKGIVRSVGYSTDGSSIVFSDMDTGVHIWDTTARREVMTLGGNEGRATCVRTSPDGRTIASGCQDGTIHLWDAETGQEMRTIKGPDCILSLAFAPDNERIAACVGKAIGVWKVESGAEVMTLYGHDEPVMTVAFSHDGERIVSGGLDNAIKLWDAHMPGEFITLPAPVNPQRYVAYPSVTCVAMSPDGTLIASGHNGGFITLWRSETRLSESPRETDG